MRLLTVFILLCVYNISSAQTADEYIQKAKEHRNDPRFEAYMLMADSIATKYSDTKKIAKINQELGQYYYTRNPDKCIEHLKKAYTALVEIKDVNNAIFCLQNIAFTYEEKKNDLTNAELYTQQAIQERKGIKDTLQLANMYKYLGYLQGKAGKFTIAKESVRTGITLFVSKKYEQGVAVCYYDMGKVYEYEQKFDSSIFYFAKSRKIWEELGNQGKRIFNVNNALMHVYSLSGNTTEAGKIFTQNKTILAKEFIYWSDKLDFYKYSAELFNKQQDKIQSAIYNAEYNNTKDSLVKAGIQVVD